jgi:uncharacterized protein (TIGR03437 family)
MRSLALTLLLAIGAHAQQLEFLNQKTSGKAARDSLGNWIFAEPSNDDIRIRKLSADLTRTLYDVTTGGSDRDGVLALQVDPDGNAYVVGSTAFKDFPITANAPWKAGLSFFLRVDGAGAITTSTYLPLFTPSIIPAGDDWVIAGTDAAGISLLRLSRDGATRRAVRVVNAGESPLLSALQSDPVGNIFLAGITGADNFPATPGAFQTNRLSSTCYGFGFFAHPYPCSTGFLMKFDCADFHTLAATYLGGKTQTTPWALAVDRQGFPYVTGTIALYPGGAESPQYPVTPGAFQTTFTGRGDLPFVTKLTPDLTALVYSTFLGGGGTDMSVAIAVDDAGRALVSGITASFDFPKTGVFPLQCTPITLNALSTGFVARLSADGSALDSSAMLDASAAIQFLEGGDPVATAGSALVRVHMTAPDGPVAACTVNGGSYRRESFVGANQLFTVKGGPFPPQTRLLFDGVPAPLLYVGDSQINAVVPASVAGHTTALMEIDVDGARSNARRFDVKPANPTVKIWIAPDGSVDNRGNLLADVGLSDGSPNTEDNPAHIGEVVTVYVTGLDLGQPLTMRLNYSDAPVLRVSVRPGSLGSVVGLDVRIPGPAGGMYVISIQNGTVQTADNAGFIWTMP